MQPYPEVSVLMPVFNAESTLIEAMESLSGQTFPGFEILAIDDGSTDQSCEHLKSWAQHDNRLRILKNSHQRYPGTLNEGLLACQGAAGRPYGRRRPLPAWTPGAPGLPGFAHIQTCRW